MPAHKDLGSILVDEDVLDAKDLARVADAVPLWAALIERELATAEQIFRALSSRFGVPVVSDERLADVSIPEKLRRVLGRGEAMKLGMLPVDLTSDGQRATVVMVDPSDEATLALFLTRAQVPEGRALLARREPLLRAIDRCFGGGDTAIVTPLPPPKPRQQPRTGPQKPIEAAKPDTATTLDPHAGAPPTVKAVDENEVTGTVKLDPELQAEMQKLPPRALQADPLTPLPRMLPRPKRATPPPTPAPTPAPATLATVDEARTGEVATTGSEALRAEERLSRALIEVVEALSAELEARLGAPGIGSEMARLARRVARQLNVTRRASDEIGVAAQLYAVDRALRAVEGTAAPDIFGALGWAAAADGGLLPMLRALTSASSGFSRQAGVVPLGARIIGAVADYLELGAASHAPPDLDTVSQLLRASPAGAQVVDALLKILQDERGDITPAEPTKLPATSVLKNLATPEPITPEPTPVNPMPTEAFDRDKTVRRPVPKRPGPTPNASKKGDEKGE